jgi:tRNA(Leu) C34 or U34 (ribose-2'-O)-methylase TrmL
MQPRRIESPDDPLLTPYRAVRDRDAAGPDGRPGLFVGESPLVVEAMLRTGTEVLSILVAERHAARAVAMVDAWRAARQGLDDPHVLVADDELLNATVGFEIHRGFLAVGRRPAPRTVAEVVPAAGRDALLLIVEEINNIDNIGQLFRNAAAFGCAAVVLSPGCHDPLYRKSLRVSCGCALQVPFARSDGWDRDLVRIRDDAGFTLVGATGSGDCTLREAAERCAGAAPRRVAVVVGAEFAGLQPQTMATCTLRARIPMASGVDSLNVGVAAGVFLARLAER